MLDFELLCSTDGPDDVTISPLKPSDYITSNSDFNLTCGAPSSNPPATFTWYHNTDEIKASGPILTLKTIEGQGYGKRLADYTCRALNAKTLRVVPSPAVRFSVMGEQCDKALWERLFCVIRDVRHQIKLKKNWSNNNKIYLKTFRSINNILFFCSQNLFQVLKSPDRLVSSSLATVRPTSAARRRQAM